MAEVVERKPRREIRGTGLVFVCGAALFSDGYLNGSIGSVLTLLRRIYGAAVLADHQRGTVFAGIGFAGIVVGQLSFGWIVDRYGRKNPMYIANIIVFVFAALSAGAYGKGGTPGSIIAALTAYRFLTGIGIGAEYPAGSVACAESSENSDVPSNRGNMLFALFTNCAIDWGFVAGAAIPLFCVLGYGENHLRAAWRTTLGVGCVVPAVIFLLRLFIRSEPEAFQRSAITRAKMPWGLIFKRYWLRWSAIALIWWIYDFSAYSFGLYSSTIIDVITGSSTKLTTVFAWNVVINSFYLPGCIGGALLLPFIGPKKLLIGALVIQAVIGYIMSGLYNHLTNHIAAFAVVYGLFLCFGEVGPGNCIGLLAAKSFPTPARGVLYGTAAAFGKVGAYCGTWAIPTLIGDYPATDSRSITVPFYLASSLALLAAVIGFFLVEITPDFIAQEDVLFKEYLAEHGYDISGMGLTDNAEGMQSHGSFEDDKVAATETTPTDEKVY
ncbi:uncharacterized protein L969DRAFT_84374 [Mixia osmundae IAM 14324]|uniref:Major facilitator superfamily (MFS) profile domain-containing protein n=1 Tax=Mixia osmundae (strain CBS 9802 / IAM 14324 / JCM 22182 / KY 12970) TaxID=764103 RepID=G7E318_MIXOS|nr:uncharacterized protein L969DRAFT_84374 [Mixia osmundae IAM 14324]KEI42512.1 hypothetical protein L969DRAFT_84374 [Mixia osmundae IAM 14324]GAA97199.1 hypothetical protein E5Q_03875 [Mixia osmundae IAM 14324]